MNKINWQIDEQFYIVTCINKLISNRLSKYHVLLFSLNIFYVNTKYSLFKNVTLTCLCIQITNRIMKSDRFQNK